MEFFIILLSIVLLFVAYPFVRFFIKRVICCLKIKRSCKRNDLKLHAAHFLCFLGLNNSRNCDFYIEASETVISVKLFGALTKTSILIFNKDGKYRVKEPFFRGIIHISKKRKSIPIYNFRYRFKDEWELKTQENTVLINPVPIDITQETDKGTFPCTTISGAQIRSLQTFLAELNLISDIEY